jgi:Tfp pilus tip-associated adhesin PilY1
MPSETLRRAAALIRERAEAAYWVDFHGKSDWSGDVAALGLDEADAAHVTGMSPAVALAVAELLEAVTETGVSEAMFRQWVEHDRSGRAALAVATTYLGES